MSSALNVLMLSLATDIVTQPLGDTRERHIEYAGRIGHLHMLVYAPREVGAEPVRVTGQFTVYPSGSRSRYLFPLDACRIGARLCRSEHIDLIATQDPFTTGLVGVWLKRRFKFPLQVNNHASFFGNRYWRAERPLRHRAFEQIGRWVVRRADALRVINADQQERYVRMGLDPERIEVIRPPIQLDRFLRAPDPGEVEALRERLGIAGGAEVVLWVGRPGATAQKRLMDLLQALVLVRRERSAAHLVVVGDLRGADYLGRGVERLGLEGAVTLAGPVEHVDLPVYYALCRVFALSSSYEGMGKVLLEAGASGRPVVATRIPGVVDVVLDGETGLLCEVENPADLADKVGALLADPERAAEMGRRARDWVRERFDRHRTIEAIVGLWERAAATRRAS